MRSRSERLATANSVKMQCINHELSEDIGTQVLYRMLDKYVEEGTTFVNKEVKLVKRYDLPRYYLVNLHNNPQINDTVLIRTKTA
jgi:hypothetical protein